VAVDPPRRLLLQAEMKLPGDALLEFQVAPRNEGQAVLSMRTRFLPKGLFGIAYWYLLYPFSQWLFYGMLKAIAKTIGKPILAGPQRFTPKIPSACRLPDEINRG
jgi:hypothetical protein